MKAIRVTAPGKIEIKNIDRPKIGPNDVLSKVKYVGICATDISILNGESFLVRDGLVKYPITLGHEWSGYVKEIGENVKSFKPGDRVVGDTSISCGICLDCMAGNYHLCQNSYGVGTVGNWDGAYAEYILYPSRHIFKIPDGISMEDAALVEPASIAGYAVSKADIKFGDTVVVQGTGAIGLFAAQLTRISGASRVILSGRKDSKLTIGKEIGADIIVNITRDDLKSRVIEFTDNNGADSVIETSGSAAALTDSFNIVKTGGTISIVSFFEQKVKEFDIDKVVLGNYNIRGSAGCPNIFPRILKLIANKRLLCRPLITHRFKFSQINEAINAMESENETRIKILMEVEQ